MKSIIWTIVGIVASSLVICWRLLKVDGDVSGGSPYGWLVGPDNFCYRSESYKCIQENTDPNCTYEVPWCPNGKSDKRRSAHGLLEGEGEGDSLKSSKRLKAYYIRKRKEYQEARLNARSNRRTTRNKNNMGSRIVRGEDTYPGAFPWAVRFVKDNLTMCSGSLIGNNEILTAAHCLVGINFEVDKVEIYLGQYFTDRKDHHVQKHEVGSFCIHPNHFENPLGGNYSMIADIAIIRTKKPVKFNKYVQPICLFRPDQTIRPDKYYGNCLGLGYGVVMVRIHDITLRVIEKLESNRLRAVGLDQVECPDWHSKMQTHTTCHKPWKVYAKTKHPQKGVEPSPCFGDSGGPLACFDPLARLWYQMGIISGGSSQCGQAESDGYDFLVDTWLFRHAIDKMKRLTDFLDFNNCQRTPEMDKPTLSRR